MQYIVLMSGSAILWTLTYALIIRHSALDRTYGMPMVALCTNIAWEFIFSCIYTPGHVSQLVVNIVWFALDAVILAQLLRYGPKEFSNLPKSLFYLTFAFTLASSFCAVLFTTLTFHDYGTYAAFAGNLLMSVAFIIMLYRRRSLRGQSLSIAICKMLGTGLSSLAFLLAPFTPHTPLLSFLYASIFIYDALYVAMVYRARHNGIWLTGASTTDVLSSPHEG